MGRNTSVYLGDHFTQFIEEQVKTGRYSSASDVIRAGLRLLEGQAEERAWLRSQIAEAATQVQAGAVYEGAEGFWHEIDREVGERMQRGDRPGDHVQP